MSVYVSENLNLLVADSFEELWEFCRTNKIDRDIFHFCREKGYSELLHCDCERALKAGAALKRTDWVVNLGATVAGRRKAEVRFENVPRLTEYGSYEVDHTWPYLVQTMDRYLREDGLNLDPDYQRGYVWTKSQQTAYVEFMLSGGRGAGLLLFNCPNWMRGHREGPFEIVDGKQRLNAAMLFLKGKLKAFGHYRDEYLDEPHDVTFRFHVNDLEPREKVLRWYLELNSGGTVHRKAELDKVRKLIEEERSKK